MIPLALASSLLSFSGDVPSAPILERARAALAADRAEPFELRAFGRRIEHETEHAFSITYDARGRFRIDPLAAGPTAGDPAASGVAGSRGFDLERAWVATGSGPPLGLPRSARASVILSAWSQTGLLLASDAGIEFDEHATRFEQGYRIGFTLPGSDVLGELDLGSHLALPRAVRWRSGENRVEHVVLGYLAHFGRRMPRRIRVRRSGRPDEEVRIERVVAAPLFRGNPYEPGAVEYAPAEFDPGADPELETRRANSGHLLVRVRVDDTDAGWFLFDSGSSTDMLDRRVARKLGLDLHGEATIRGLAGERRAEYARAASLEIGPMRVRDPVFMCMDLGFLQSAFGRALGGMIGYDTLSRAVFEVEPAAARIRAHAPESYDPGMDPGWIPISLEGRHATARARVDGHEGRFIVDTGSDAEIAVRSDFAERTGLLDGRRKSRVVVKGALERLSVLAVEIDHVTLGPRRIVGPEALVYDEDARRRITGYSDGILGAPLFSGWRLILDYPRRRVATLPVLGP